MRQRSVATVSPTRTRRRREALSDVVGGLDEVDAVTRGPLAAATAYGRVLAAAGRQFDPGVVDALEHGVRDESLRAAASTGTGRSLASAVA
jgi:hypothetical protein